MHTIQNPYSGPGLQEGVAKPFLRRNTEEHGGKKYKSVKNNYDNKGSSGLVGPSSAHRPALHYPSYQQLHEYGCMDPPPNMYQDPSINHQYHNQSAALVEIGSESSHYPSSF